MMRILDDWLLLPQRFAVHEPSATAVLADVHLGYSAARQRLGDAIPWRSVAEEVSPLVVAAASHDIRAVIVAGDLFESGFDAAIFAQWLDVLDRLKIRFAGLVPGNHDGAQRQSPSAKRGKLTGKPAPSLGARALKLPSCTPLANVYPDGYDLAGWRIRHGDEQIDDERSVSGHWHPAVRWKRRKVPCFLARGRRLILPAFSLDGAGVDVRSDARWHDWDCYALHGTKIAVERLRHGVEGAPHL